MTNIKRGEKCSMAVGCMDGDVQIFDNEYSLIRTIEGEKQGVTSLSVTKEGDFIFIACKNNIIKLFQLGSNKKEKDQEKIKIKSLVSGKIYDPKFAYSFNEDDIEGKWYILKED